VSKISKWLEARHPRILGQTPAEVSCGAWL